MQVAGAEVMLRSVCAVRRGAGAEVQVQVQVHRCRGHAEVLEVGTPGAEVGAGASEVQRK